jgi:broad specificity phosphatase PhoE/ribonuclease HI
MRLVVEADGGSRGNPGPAGYGAVVRDRDTGRLLREVAAGIGRATNNVAEYRGLIAGLQAAAEMDPRADVEVRMDSKLVVEQMSGRWRVRHADMAALAGEAARLVRGFSAVRFTHIPRELNTAADGLANAAMDAAARGEPWAPSGDPPAAPANRVVGWAPVTGPVTTAFLLRHGETEHSVEGRFSGVGRLRLTTRGLAQAQAAGDRLRGERPTAVVSSPLPRSLATAEIVAAACRVPVVEEAELRETDFGDWEGLSYAEVADRWPAELDRWLADPEYPPPNGESLVSTERRLRPALDRLLAGHPGERLVLVTHVTPIKTLLRLALGAPASALFRLHLDLASLSVIDYHSDGLPVVRRVNDVAHLAGC